MSAALFGGQSADRPSSTSSTQATTISAASTTPVSPAMKDVSNSKAARPSAYPKKRPSPHGVAKSRKQHSPLYPPQVLVRKTPRAAKAEMIAHRQRDAQIMALRREGIYLEEEYREEIRYYMLEMEVSVPRRFHVFVFSQGEICCRCAEIHDVFDNVYGPTT